MKKLVGLGLTALLSLGGCGDDSGNGNTAGTGGIDPAPMAATNPMAAGMPNPMNGAGAGGAAGMGTAGTGVSPSDLHAGAHAVLTAESPCGFMSCHTGRGKAGLVLTDITNLRESLVGMPSCEAPAVPMVADGGGQAALDNSWLYLKLTAPIDASGALMQNAAWGESGSCGQLPSQPYGLRMPMGSTDTLEEARLAPIRDWIFAGAPGP